MGGLDYGWWASAMAFAVSMSATPGPNNTMVTASGASWGFRRSIPHILGVGAGFPLMLVVVALGAGEVLRSTPWLQDAMRWVGAAYLLWLAWHIATSHPSGGTGGRPPKRPLGFTRAFLFQWVNPKAWVVALGAVVTYTSADHVLVQSGALAAIFLAATLLMTALWTIAGVGAARLLRNEQALRMLNIGLAVLLVLSLVPLFWGE